MSRSACSLLRDLFKDHIQFHVEIPPLSGPYRGPQLYCRSTIMSYNVIGFGMRVCTFGKEVPAEGLLSGLQSGAFCA